MYTVAGATGRVGSVVARRLLAEGAPVRVLVRNEAAAAAWAERGAETREVHLDDRDGLATALAGSDGFFVLLPFDLGAEDFHAETRAQVAAIAGAVTDSGVPHVAMLSSAGADLPQGTGPIVGLYLLEEALRATGTVVSAIRSGHFQEKVSDVLDAARHGGIYPVFASSADVPTPMVATRDIGEVAAQALLSPPSRSEAVDLKGPSYTEHQVADLLATALGQQLEVVTVPRDGWAGALQEAGFSAHIAEVLVGLYDADERGLLAPRGDRSVPTTTDLSSTLAGLVGEPA